MSDREELSAAHRRIAQLERTIAERKAPPKPVAVRSIVYGCCAFAAFSMYALVLVYHNSAPPRTDGPAPLPPAKVDLPAPKPFVVPMFWNGPIAADVGGDGTEDIIAVFAYPGETSAEIAALDGATFKPLWRTRIGGFHDRRPHTFLRRVADKAVLVDRSSVRSYDLRTGAESGMWPTEVETWDFCPFENGEPRAYLERETFDHGAILDLERATLTEAPKKQATLGCHGRSDMPLCATTHALPCESARNVMGKTLSQAYVTYEDDDTTATVGWSPKEQNAPYFGVFADKQTKKTIWEGRLSLPEDAGHEHDFRYAYAGGKVIVTYLVAPVGRRVVAHDVESGRLAWHTTVGQPGSSLEGLSGTTTRLYLALDDRIVVIDPMTGRELSRVMALEAQDR